MEREEQMEREWEAMEDAGPEANPESEMKAEMSEAEGAQPEADALDAPGGEAPETALERERAQWQSQRQVYERRIADMEEERLAWEAAKLAKEEGISESIALRLLRAERGQTSQPVEGVRLRAEALMDQAELVRRATGVDVLERFRGDAEVRRRVARGEWDFADVAAHSRAAVPVPARSPGAAGAPVGRQSFSRMSAEAFARFDEMLKTGEFDATR